MSLSKTAAAAAKAVQRGIQKEEKPFDWPQVLKNIRINLDAKLAVTPGAVRMLLEHYDALIATANAAPMVPNSFNPRAEDDFDPTSTAEIGGGMVRMETTQDA